MNITKYSRMSTEGLRELLKTAGGEDAAAISSILATRALMSEELEKQKREEATAHGEEAENAGEEQEKTTRQAKQHSETIAAALAAFRRNTGRTVEFYSSRARIRLRGVITRVEYDKRDRCCYYHISSIPLTGMPRKAYKKKASSPDILYISHELAPDDALEKVESIGKKIGNTLLPEIEWASEKPLIRSAVLPYMGCRVEYRNRTGRVIGLKFTDKSRFVEWLIALDKEFSGLTTRPLLEYTKDAEGKIKIKNKFQRVFPPDKHTAEIREAFWHSLGTRKRHKLNFADLIVACEGDIRKLTGYLRLIQFKIDERQRLIDFAKSEVNRLLDAKIEEINLM